MRINGIVLMLVVAAVLSGCGWGGGTNKESAKGSADNALIANLPADAPLRSFPELVVPSVYGDNVEGARAYVLEHYWDGFLKGDGRTNPEAILGVRDAELEQALANYIQILATMKLLATPDSMGPLKQAQGSMKHFFKGIEARQLKDTSSRAYLRLTEMVSKYLYDPNSPMRDEDLYLPFVEAMAESPCTRDDMRNAYRYEARMCSTNPYGSKAPDFRFSSIRGDKYSLYGVKAEYTMLFFSNPGCESCKAIIEDVMSRKYIPGLIAEHKLAIINVYIDEEVEKWRAYSHNYPSEWINGYDFTFSLRESGKYDIRAIPSLYLLDASKRVLMKDAPTERVLSFLDKL